MSGVKRKGNKYITDFFSANKIAKITTNREIQRDTFIETEEVILIFKQNPRRLDFNL